MKSNNKTIVILVTVFLVIGGCAFLLLGVGVGVWYTSSQNRQPATAREPAPKIDVVKFTKTDTASLETPTLTPTKTPEPTRTPTATITPTSTPTPTPKPRPTLRTDLSVCDVDKNDEYLGAYVEWRGVQMGPPMSEQEFQILHLFTGEARGNCLGAFFVMTKDKQPFYPNDDIVVDGFVADTKFEYQGGGGRVYAVVLDSDILTVTNKIE